MKFDFNTAVITVAVTVAVCGGGFAAKEIMDSNATSIKTASERNGVLQARAKANPKKGVVPFGGRLKLGNCGVRVHEMQDALRRIHVRKSKATRCFGKGTKRDVVKFQLRVNYNPTGVYTLATHQALVKRHGYTNKSRQKLIYYSYRAYNGKIRATIRLVALHLVLVGGNTQGYTQSGQRAAFPPWPQIPRATDCSGEVTWIAYQSGFGAALGYYGPGSPVGWTGTLMRQGRIVAPQMRLLVGDLIFYPGHVSMYIGSGKEISHGGVGVDIRGVGNYDQVRRYIR